MTRVGRPASVGQQPGAVMPIAHGGEGADDARDRRGRHHAAEPVRRLRRSLRRCRGQNLRKHRLGDRRGAALSRAGRSGVACAAGLRAVGLRTGVHQDQRPHALAPPAQELEDHVPAHREAAQHHVVHAQRVEQRREVVRVDRHAVAEVGRVGLSHPAQVGRDAAVTVERVDLVAPDRAVERIAVDEQDRRTLAARSRPPGSPR